jgi:hypothetical protein
MRDDMRKSSYDLKRSVRFVARAMQEFPAQRVDCFAELVFRKASQNRLRRNHPSAPGVGVKITTRTGTIQSLTIDHVSPWPLDCSHASAGMRVCVSNNVEICFEQLRNGEERCHIRMRN